MRKTYKPVARVENASQIFRKKTLNVNDDLNIKHDADDIENVDEYWSTAMSVIGNSTIDSIETETQTEPSDTLFNINNIRKSLRNDQNKTKSQEAEDMYKKSVDRSNLEEKNLEDSTFHLSERSDENLGNIDVPKREKTNTETGKPAIIKSVFTPDTDPSLIPITKDSFNRSVEETGLFNQNSVSNDPDFSVDFNNDIEEIKEESMSKGEIEFKNKNKGEAMPALKTFSTNKTSTRKAEKTENKHTKDSSVSFESKKLDGSRESRTVKTNGFEVENTAKEYKNNKISPILCTNSIDVALMNLDYLAYIEDHQTENSFSVYVVKGKIEMIVKKKSKILSKGDVTVIEKDSIYSLNCVSKSGAVLLLSYAL